MTAEKRKELQRRLGADTANMLFELAADKSRRMDAVATSFKDYGDSLEDRVNEIAEGQKAIAAALVDILGSKAKEQPAKPKKPTRSQGEPSDLEELNADETDVVDDDIDPEKIGARRTAASAKKSRLALAKSLRRKAAKLEADAEDDDEDTSAEDDSEQDGDSEDGDEDAMVPAKRKSKARRGSPAIGLKEIAMQFNAMSQQMNQTQQLMAQQQKAMADSINALAREIANPTPATRSQRNIVPESDPALQFLSSKMNGAGDTAPNTDPATMGAQDYSALVFGNAFKLNQ
jgi:hypothetical protein